MFKEIQASQSGEGEEGGRGGRGEGEEGGRGGRERGEGGREGGREDSGEVYINLNRDHFLARVN